MLTCLHHPEVSTSHSCAVCGQPFCNACLERCDGVGLVCVECEQILARENSAELTQRLPLLKVEVRQGLPIVPQWWGWRLLAAIVVLLPSLASLPVMFQRYRDHQIVAMISREPLLPDLTYSRLIEVGSALEKYHKKHGNYPESLDLLANSAFVPAATLMDVYSDHQESLVYIPRDERFLLCSRGPDRVMNGGMLFDRFTGVGDFCL